MAKTWRREARIDGGKMNANQQSQILVQGWIWYTWGQRSSNALWYVRLSKDNRTATCFNGFNLRMEELNLAKGKISISIPEFTQSRKIWICFALMNGSCGPRSCLYPQVWYHQSLGPTKKSTRSSDDFWDANYLSFEVYFLIFRPNANALQVRSLNHDSHLHGPENKSKSLP